MDGSACGKWWVFIEIFEPTLHGFFLPSLFFVLIRCGLKALFPIVKTDNASWKSLVPKTSSFHLNIIPVVSSSCGIKISQCNQHDQDIIWSKEGGNWNFHSRCKVLLLFCLFVFSHSLELLWDFRLRSYSTGWIFDWLKILTGHFVHTGPFNICALFTRNFEPPGV